MSLRSRTGLKAFEVEHQKEQAVAEEQRFAPIRAAALRTAELQAELNTAELNLLLSQPSAELAAKCPQFDPTTEEITSAEAVTAAIGEAWNVFRLALEAEGVRVQSTAQAKFARILELNRQIDSRKPETFRAIYEAIDSLNGWSEREVTKPVQVVAPAKAQTESETPEDIEQIDTSTRAGQKTAKQIVDKQFWKSVSPLFHEWVASLYTYWKFVPSEEQKKQVCNLIEALNLSPIDRKTYDVARRAAYERGIFPELLTNEEILTRELEMFKRNNPEASERDERVWFARRQRELEVHA